jgi:hypothetical protein
MGQPAGFSFNAVALPERGLRLTCTTPAQLGKARVCLYDVGGRCIARAFSGEMKAGTHVFVLEKRKRACGAYIALFSAGSQYRFVRKEMVME